MKTGQRVVCIKQDEWVTTRGRIAKKTPKYGDTVTISRVRQGEDGNTYLHFEETDKPAGFWSKWFRPETENWTNEVITKALQQQLTEPVNNGLHFSQIIG